MLKKKLCTVIFKYSTITVIQEIIQRLYKESELF